MIILDVGDAKPLSTFHDWKLEHNKLIWGWLVEKLEIQMRFTIHEHQDIMIMIGPEFLQRGSHEQKEHCLM